jgi:hypothetical protein
VILIRKAVRLLQTTEYLVVNFDNIEYIIDTLNMHDTQSLFEEMVANGEIFIEGDDIGFIADKLHIVALMICEMAYQSKDYRMGKTLQDLATVILSKHCEIITRERMADAYIGATIKSKAVNGTLH